MWKWETEQAKAVVVMVHGAAEHHGRYQWLINKWRKAGYHVIMGDLPGQGNTSEKERGHIPRFDVYIETVESWYKEAMIYNLPIILLGHSMGGLTVLRTMQEKQLDISSIILSSPCLGIAESTTPSPFLDALSKVLNVVTPTFRMDMGINPSMTTRNQEVLEVDRNDTLYLKKVSIRWFRELINSIELAFHNINKLPEVPILIMQGGDDIIVNKEKGKQFFDQLTLSDKTYKEWPGLYHEIFNEPEREEVFNYTVQFVETRVETKVQ